MNVAQPTQVLVTAYPSISKQAALSAPLTKQLAIYMARAANGSGSAVDTGLVRRFNQAAVKLYTFDGTSTYTQVMAKPLAGANTATIFTNAGTAGNGYVLQSKTKSGIFGFTVSQSGSGGVYAFEYWTGAAWVAFTPMTVGVVTSAADSFSAFLPPVDWVAGGPAGLDSSLFAMRVRATTRPAADVQINDLWGGALLEFYPAVANNTGVSLEFDVLHPLILEGGEGIMPYFKTANAANAMTIAYTTF